MIPLEIVVRDAAEPPRDFVMQQNPFLQAMGYLNMDYTWRAQNACTRCLSLKYTMFVFGSTFLRKYVCMYAMMHICTHV